MSALPPKADLPNFRITPAASFTRMPPSRPRATARSLLAIMRTARRPTGYAPGNLVEYDHIRALMHRAQSLGRGAAVASTEDPPVAVLLVAAVGSRSRGAVTIQE
jgi:hypothetical protein